jgi:zinc/manganese transport system permease protein
VAVLTAVLLGLWFGLRERLGRLGFYVLFAFAVTASVQLVGVYLVFASLIVPALACRNLAARRQLAVGYALGACGYALGLALSALFDLPSGAVIVWAIALLGFGIYLLATRAARVPPSRATSPAGETAAAARDAAAASSAAPDNRR